MARPVPLMFINSPTTFLEPYVEEESTSIFKAAEEWDEEEMNDSIEDDFYAEDPFDDYVIRPLVKSQLKKIQSPIGRRLYRPVQVKVASQKEYVGTIEKIEEKTIFLKENLEEDESIGIPIIDIIDIHWQGKSIPEK